MVTKVKVKTSVELTRAQTQLSIEKFVPRKLPSASTDKQPSQQTQNICTTSVQCLRRWPNFVQKLYKCVVCAVIRCNGFCQVKKNPKIRKKTWKWVGGSSPNLDFFFGNILFINVVFFFVYVSKKNKKLDRLVWTIRVFLGFLDFF